MPGIHFAAVREMISLADVLELIGFVSRERVGDQVRGSCPVHESASPRNRSFSANLKRNVWQCFRCGSSGNQLDLYVAVTRLTLFEAAVDLCERLRHDVPWIGSR